MRPITCILSSNNSNFMIDYLDPIMLKTNRQYEAALLSLETYNTFPNITHENNIFEYSTDNGVTWKIIALDTGSYELSAINDEIQRQMILNDDYDSVNNKFYITITANVSELKSVITVTNPTYQIDFSVENSIGPTLGFRPLIIQHGYNKSQEIVDIMKINSILVNTDFISGSYVNGMQSPVIYSFFPNVSPGRKIVEKPNPTLIYYPVIKSTINSIKIWLTDQDCNPIDLRSERLTVRILIREVKDMKQDIKKAVRELKEEKII